MPWNPHNSQRPGPYVPTGGNVRSDPPPPPHPQQRRNPGIPESVREFLPFPFGNYGQSVLARNMAVHGDQSGSGVPPQSNSQAPTESFGLSLLQNNMRPFGDANPLNGMPAQPNPAPPQTVVHSTLETMARRTLPESSYGLGVLLNHPAFQMHLAPQQNSTTSSSAPPLAPQYQHHISDPNVERQLLGASRIAATGNLHTGQGLPADLRISHDWTSDRRTIQSAFQNGEQPANDYQSRRFPYIAVAVPTPDGGHELAPLSGSLIYPFGDDTTRAQQIHAQSNMQADQMNNYHMRMDAGHLHDDDHHPDHFPQVPATGYGVPVPSGSVLHQLLRERADDMQLAQIVVSVGEDSLSKIDLDTKYTPLMAAAATGRSNVLAALFDRGVSLGVLDENDNNAIMIASAYGKADAVRTLNHQLITRHGPVAALGEMFRSNADHLDGLGLAIVHGHTDVVSVYANELQKMPLDDARSRVGNAIELCKDVRDAAPAGSPKRASADLNLAILESLI